MYQALSSPPLKQGPGEEANVRLIPLHIRILYVSTVDHLQNFAEREYS